MSQRFKTRGYQQKTISRAYNKAKCLPREQQLASKQKNPQNSNQVYFVLLYIVIKQTDCQKKLGQMEK